MNVHFYANYRQLAGGKTVPIELPDGSSIAALIDELFHQIPALRPAMMAEGGQLFPHVHLFVNGRDTQYLPQGMSTPLYSTDKIDIFPPVAGG
jgi:sulfur-carrier protein